MVRSQSWYDIAQICLNGHVINSQFIAKPEHRQEFCDKCGAPTITTCQNCNSTIRGDYHVSNVGGYFRYLTPAFCCNCGVAYTWTDAKLKASQELSDEMDNLSDNEKELLKKSLDDIIKDTPQAMVAATRFKKLIATASKDIKESFRGLLVDIVSEAAKKMLWP